MLKKMGGMIAAATIAVALMGCAAAIPAISAAADVVSSLGGLGQLQFLPAAPASVTAPAQDAVNKAKVTITIAAGGVTAAGDGLKLAASLGVLKGTAAHTARVGYDTAVAAVNASVSAVNAAQSAINAGAQPNLANLSDALAKVNEAVAKAKALAGGG